jgi:phosphatidylglycerophosphatase A
LIATAFGIGLLPGMPGSWASLAALPCAWLIRSAGGLAAVGIAAFIAFALGWWASARVARASHAADPSYVVVDEVAAQWLVLLGAPFDWRWYAVAFLLFRLFDIWKPFPVSWVDRHVKGGIGIMLDDVVAALCALIPIAIAEGALGVRP